MPQHEGHRERLKRRFIAEGLEHFEPHNVLELMLFYSIPRKDTNPIAHRLLEHFGSLVAVFNASPEELVQVEGITMNSAVHLHMISQVARRYFSEALEAPPEDALIEQKMCHFGKKLIASCAGLSEEHLYVICLNNGMRELCFECVARGVPNRVMIPTRDVVALAMKHHASAIILAHNHPGGIAIPSSEDVAATHQLKKVLTPLSIELLDHFVVAGNDYVSMAQSGQLAEGYRFTSENSSGRFHTDLPQGGLRIEEYE